MITLDGGNFHRTCIEWWPPNRQKNNSNRIRIRMIASSISFITQIKTETSHNNWNFNFAWISYHDISNNAFWKIASPFHSCWCVEFHDMDMDLFCVPVYCVSALLCSAWICKIHLYVLVCVCFHTPTVISSSTSTKLDGKNGPDEWKRPGRTQTEWKIREIKQNWYFVYVLAWWFDAKRNAEEMSLTHVLSCEKRKRSKKNHRTYERRKKNRASVPERHAERGRQKKSMHT